MLQALLLLLLAALLAPALTRLLPRHAGACLALLPLGIFFWLLSHMGSIADGQVLEQRVSWIAALQIAVHLRLDGLSLLFGLLISGIGSLIVLYAAGYLEQHRQLGRFYAYLLLFMLAMLGLVLADDLILLFVFWELTSVASFLLIGFQHDKPEARRAALQALLITGGGGLALLAGLLLLGGVAQTWQISSLDAAQVQGHALFPAIMLLVLLGCFSKSAQLPFHLWLPNAMNAPTPVSAFLHSATMVKAGVFLLARLNPSLGGSLGWSSLLIAFGAATALLGALLAIRQTDLKRLLAYTTVAVLGQLTMLIGSNTPYGLQAFVLYLVAHSLYKAALFMAVGAIDHATGTREYPRLGGLWRFMPLTGCAVALAAFSNAGLPPFFGFIAKEFKYSGLLELGLVGGLITTVMILTNALLFAAAGLVFVKSFLGPPGAYPRQPHEVSLPLWLGPLLLALGGFLLGAWNSWPETWLVNIAVQNIASGPVDVSLYLWGGFTPALLASLLTISLGLAFYLRRDLLLKLLGRLQWFWQFSGDLLWDRLLKRVFAVAALTASAFQHGSLRQHLALLALCISLLLGIGITWLGWPLAPFDLHQASLPALLAASLSLLGALGAAWLPGRLSLVAALGLSGLGLTLLFFLMQAPDVAMTMLMVESLGVVLLALIYRRMPRVAPQSRGLAWPRALLAGLFGLSIGLALLVSSAAPLPGDLAQWYLANSYGQGHGANVVNVILVDFRAFDTLGEIVVVALAMLAAASLLGRTPAKLGTGDPVFASSLLLEGLKPLVWLLLGASLLLLWRGHNLPGGGFIGGLTAAAGCVLLVLMHGPASAERLLRLRPRTLMGIGLAVALLAASLGLLGGGAFFQAHWLWLGELPLGTPLLFDLGVYLCVFGASLHLFQRLTAEEHAA